MCKLYLTGVNCQIATVYAQLWYLTKTEYILGYIKASNYRKKIIKSLQDKKLTPIELAKETDIPLSHISNTLANLLEKDVVVCLTPKLKKGRLYELTKKGYVILKNLE